MSLPPNITKGIFLGLFIALLGFLYFCSSKMLSYWPIDIQYYYIRIAACAIGGILTLKLIHLFAVKAEISERRKGMRLLFLTLFLLFFVVEGIFSFIPRSHGGGITLASRLWFWKYWDTNELGYRDQEIEPRASEATFKIAVLGDSYVAGHGIQDPKDRWSDQLKELLPPGYEVFNIGDNGSHTVDQLAMLRAYPVKPDLLLFSHIPNDMEYFQEPDIHQTIQTADSLWQTQAGFLPLNGLSNHSFLFDYFHNKFKNVFHSYQVQELEDLQKYPSGLTIWTDRDKLNFHLLQIQKILDHGAVEGYPVVTVLWPSTHEAQIDVSRTVVNQPIESYCQARNYPVFDTYPALKEIPFKDRIVSVLDVHPSPASCQKVAKDLHAFLVAEDLLSPSPSSSETE